MVDKVSPEVRSKTMRAVGSRDTNIELALRRELWGRGLRYRVEPTIAETRPDLAFFGPRVAVFVDGCFWHGCPRCYSEPEANSGYWRKKLETNRERDRRDTRRLIDAGWTVLRFWGCDITNRLGEVVTKIDGQVHGA